MDDKTYFVKSTPPRAFSTYHVYHFNTLQVCYRQIEDMHEEV